MNWNFSLQKSIDNGPRVMITTNPKFVCLNIMSLIFQRPDS